MMKMKARLLCISLFLCWGLTSAAQADNKLQGSQPKPYKLSSSGKQLTIRSTKNISHIMLWTTGGNRVAEQKEINSNNYVLDITAPQKTFFLMITLNDGKIYTEKIGLR
jgi:hypothetical protein